MNNKKPNAELVLKQFEDFVAPQLRLSVLDRAVYHHLLRHSRLEGKRRLRFSIHWLARAIRRSCGPTRETVRRLAKLGLLRLVECSKAGHLVDVRLPEEIRDCLPAQSYLPRRAVNLEEADFLQTSALRQSIHSRERGRCFYCLRLIPSRTRCLDHVVPRAQSGSNSYRNLVSCCTECNSQKRERPAGDLLRWLYRERTLTRAELAARLRTLKALAAGKLPPPLTPACLPRQASRGALQLTHSDTAHPPGGPFNPFPRKGRPPGSNCPSERGFIFSPHN